MPKIAILKLFEELIVKDPVFDMSGISYLRALTLKSFEQYKDDYLPFLTANE